MTNDKNIDSQSESILLWRAQVKLLYTNVDTNIVIVLGVNGP